MKPASPDMSWMNLPNLPLSVKALFSGYLLTIGLGLCMAGLQIMLTHGMADGKPGLSYEDIVYSYYGDRSGSHLESKLNGSMKGMGTPEARLDIIKWVRAGAPEADWEPRLKDTFGQHCAMCHSTTPNIPDFTKYEEVKKLAKTSEGSNIDQGVTYPLIRNQFYFLFCRVYFQLRDRHTEMVEDSGHYFSLRFSDRRRALLVGYKMDPRLCLAHHHWRLWL